MRSNLFTPGSGECRLLDLHKSIPLLPATYSPDLRMQQHAREHTQTRSGNRKAPLTRDCGGAAVRSVGGIQCSLVDVSVRGGDNTIYGSGRVVLETIG